MRYGRVNKGYERDMSENLKDTGLSFDEFDERRRPATVTTSFDDVLDCA